MLAYFTHFFYICVTHFVVLYKYESDYDDVDYHDGNDDVNKKNNNRIH